MTNFASMQPLLTPNCGAANGKQNKQSYGNTNYYSTLTAGYNKSSSYPNFNSSGGIQHGSHHHSYHRHSVSNLITITPSQTTASIVTTPSASHLHHHAKSIATTISSSAAGINSKLSQNNNNNFTSNANLSSTNDRLHTFGGAANQQILSSTNVVGDLSNDRDFFIRQIAEQAIN